MKILQIGDKQYPEKLMKIKNPPQKIYIEGNIEILNNFGIAIIGSRNCTKYGERIDSFAHIACIENYGKTIAVLPCGFNNIFPKENKKLYENIINNGGTVITEYEPDEQKSYNKFLERNRIVSGLAYGTLVIEAGTRSGTSVTARFTEEQGKNVFCIPSSLENTKGVGTNNLIKKGAKLVTCIEDILKEYENMNFKKKKIDNIYRIYGYL